MFKWLQRLLRRPPPPRVTAIERVSANEIRFILNNGKSIRGSWSVWYYEQTGHRCSFEVGERLEQLRIFYYEWKNPLPPEGVEI